MEQIFSMFKEAITIHDKEFNIVYANSAAKKLLNASDADLIQHKCYESYHGLKSPPEYCLCNKVLKTRESLRHRFFEKHINKYIEITYIPQINNKNQILGLIHFVRDVTKKTYKEEALLSSLKNMQGLMTNLEQIKKEGNKRIARLIHDEIGPVLSFVNLEIVRMGNNKTKRPVSEQKKIVELSKHLKMSIKKMQETIMHLRPTIIDEMDILTAIESQSEDFQKNTGIRFNIKFDIDLVKIKKEYEITVFLIYKEVLENVMRHANATRVSVRLKMNNDHLVLVVRDNGKGLKKAHIIDPKSFGIIGMNERAANIGGTLTIKGTNGKGTSVTLNIPMIDNPL